MTKTAETFFFDATAMSNVDFEVSGYDAGTQVVVLANGTDVVVAAADFPGPLLFTCPDGDILAVEPNDPAIRFSEGVRL